MASGSEMTPHDVKVLDDVSVSDEGTEATRDLIIGLLRPQWRDKPVIQKSLSSGYINKMRLYKLESDSQCRDAIVVRVFAVSVPAFVDRDNEIAAMQLAHSSDLGPRLLAVFANGIAYQYCKGENLLRSHLRDPTAARLVAQSLAKLHSTDVNRATMNKNGESCISYKIGFAFYKRFYQALDAYSEDLLDPDMVERVRQELPCVSELRKELQEMELFTDKMHFSRADLAHGDFQGNNILYDVDTGGVTFVDFEFARPGLVAYDFLHLLHLGYVFQDVIRLRVPDLGGPITDDVLDMWVRPYLVRRYELQGQDANDVTEEDIDRLKMEIKIMEVYYNLVQAIVKFVFLTGGMDLPLIELCKHVLKRFYENKPSLSVMEKEMVKLKSGKK